MGCVQFMCARIGMVTGKGLGGALRLKIPRWALIIAAFALFGANSINVGSDLSGIADAAGMLTGLNSHWFVVIFGVGIAYWTVRCRYYQIAIILKWLALCLFAYVITAFVVRPHWARLFTTLSFRPGRRITIPGKIWSPFSAPPSVLIFSSGKRRRR